MKGGGLSASPLYTRLRPLYELQSKSGAKRGTAQSEHSARQKSKSRRNKPISEPYRVPSGSTAQPPRALYESTSSALRVTKHLERSTSHKSPSAATRPTQPSEHSMNYAAAATSFSSCKSIQKRARLCKLCLSGNVNGVVHVGRVRPLCEED